MFYPSSKWNRKGVATLAIQPDVSVEGIWAEEDVRSCRGKLCRSGKHSSVRNYEVHPITTALHIR